MERTLGDDIAAQHCWHRVAAEDFAGTMGSEQRPLTVSRVDLGLRRPLHDDPAMMGQVALMRDEGLVWKDGVANGRCQSLGTRLPAREHASDNGQPFRLKQAFPPKPCGPARSNLPADGSQKKAQQREGCRAQKFGNQASLNSSGRGPDNKRLFRVCA
jgi:hypothetical protein